jgi:hypothetical protein
MGPEVSLAPPQPHVGDESGSVLAGASFGDAVVGTDGGKGVAVEVEPGCGSEARVSSIVSKCSSYVMEILHLV